MHNSYSLVLITGVPRSGTTWLNRELCLLEGTYPYISECTYITKQVELYHNTINYINKERFKNYFGTKEQIVKYYQENIKKLIDIVSIINYQNNATKLILKDPQLVLYLNDLENVFPDHKLIIIIRDPRDVLASLKNVLKRKKETFEIHKQAELHYNYYFKISKNIKKNTFIIKYEDLVSSDFKRNDFFLSIGMKLENKIHNFTYADIQKNIDIKDPFFSQLWFKKTTKDTIGNYTNTLSTKEIDHIEYIFAKVLKDYNYT